MLVNNLRFSVVEHPEGNDSGIGIEATLPEGGRELLHLVKVNGKVYYALESLTNRFRTATPVDVYDAVFDFLQAFGVTPEGKNIHPSLNSQEAA